MQTNNKIKKIYAYKSYNIVFLEKFIPYEPHKYNHESCKN